MFYRIVFAKVTGKYPAWKVSIHGVFSGPYFPILGLNTGKYGPEKILYLETFHAAVLVIEF